MGFRWSMLVRITPMNGLPETIPLNASTLEDARGPILVHPRYEPVEETEDDVEREIRQRTFGWRYSYEIGFVVTQHMTNQATLQRIRAAAAHPEKTVELSLDGGATFREVVATGDFSPERLRGKWTAGAEYALTLMCKRLYAEPPAITSVDGQGNANAW